MHTQTLSEQGLRGRSPFHVEEIDPSELRVHELAKRLPRWTADDPRFKALVEDIRARGMQAPLRVDAENRILDGVETWKAAKQLQWKKVEIVRTADDPATVIVMGLATRKHYSKGALAYVCFPLLKPAWEASRKRQLANLGKGSDRASTESTLGKIEDFCEFLGFKRDLFFQAKELHAAFEKSDRAVAEWEAKHGDGSAGTPNRAGGDACAPQDLRGQFERKLLEGEIGLGALLAGIAGQEYTKGQARADHGQLSLFDKWFEESEVRFERWDKLREDEKRIVGQKIKGLVKAMPEELREQWKKALKAAGSED